MAERLKSTTTQGRYKLTKILDSKTLGKAIKERRKALNYTQSYIAGFTGFSTSFISDVENGKPTVELEKTIPFCRYWALI